MEEKVMNGILCWKLPYDTWTQYTPKELTTMLIEARKKLEAAEKHATAPIEWPEQDDDKRTPGVSC